MGGCFGLFSYFVPILPLQFPITVFDAGLSFDSLRSLRTNA